jgi:hypothetical protein
MNLNQFKVEYVISFSDALFPFSVTFMALSIQTPTSSSNITGSELTRRLGQSFPHLYIGDRTKKTEILKMVHMDYADR